MQAFLTLEKKILLPLKLLHSLIGTYTTAWTVLFVSAEFILTFHNNIIITILLSLQFTNYCHSIFKWCVRPLGPDHLQTSTTMQTSSEYQNIINQEIITGNRQIQSRVYMNDLTLIQITKKKTNFQLTIHDMVIEVDIIFKYNQITNDDSHFFKFCLIRVG